MKRKRLQLTLMVAALLLVACGHKNPGMNKEEVAEALASNAVAEQKAAEEQAFPENYRPQAGIKFKADINTKLATVLDIAKAIKNKQPLTQEMRAEWEQVNPPILSVDSLRGGKITPVDDQYSLLTCHRGIYLLDSKYTLIKQLFRNEAEIGKKFWTPHWVIMDAYYDTSMSQLRCRYYYQDMEKHQSRLYIATLPWERLLHSPSVWTPDSIKSKLPAGSKNLNWINGGQFAGIPGGYVLTVPDTDTFYTHDVKGDTLCRFAPKGETDKWPRSMQWGELTQACYLGGVTYIYPAYDEYIYRFTAPGKNEDNTNYDGEQFHQLHAVYRLNFGALKHVTPYNLGGKLENTIFINHIAETKNYLFISLSKRDGNSSVDYDLIYDKAKNNLFAYDKPEQS
jgi:hypothetical protein